MKAWIERQKVEIEAEKHMKDSPRLTDYSVEALIAEQKKDFRDAEDYLEALRFKYLNRRTAIHYSQVESARSVEAEILFRALGLQYEAIAAEFDTARRVLNTTRTRIDRMLLATAMKMSRKTVKLKTPKVPKKHGLPVIKVCSDCAYSKKMSGSVICTADAANQFELGNTDEISPPIKCPLRQAKRIPELT